MMGMADGQTHLWGVCGMGGTHGIGTIFMADSNGNNFTAVYSFDSAHGQDPLGNLILAPNGKIYGIVALDTCIADRIMFEYDPITHTNLDVFDFYSNYNSCWTLDGMILGIDGNLYGLSIRGGTYNDGLIYRFHPDTHVFDTLYNFNSLTGKEPSGRLLQINNKLYGATNTGGANNDGVIFCFDLSTLTYTDLHDFDLIHGANPDFGSLIIGSDGKLYGTTPNGGTNNYGVIFSYDTSANIYSVVHYFDNTYGVTLMGN